MLTPIHGCWSAIQLPSTGKTSLLPSGDSGVAPEPGEQKAPPAASCGAAKKEESPESKVTKARRERVPVVLSVNLLLPKRDWFLELRSVKSEPS